MLRSVDSNDNSPRMCKGLRGEMARVNVYFKNFDSMIYHVMLNVWRCDVVYNRFCMSFKIAIATTF